MKAFRSHFSLGHLSRPVLLRLLFFKKSNSTYVTELMLKELIPLDNILDYYSTIHKINCIVTATNRYSKTSINSMK